MSAVRYPLDTIRAALLGSLDVLTFSLDLVPAALLVDPIIPGQRWGVTMQLAHLAVYEDRLAAPVLEAMAGGSDASAVAPSGSEDWLLHDAQALSRETPVAILRVLGAARERQVAAVDRFSAEAFDRPLTPLWGRLQPAGWVAAVLGGLHHTYRWRAA